MGTFFTISHFPFSTDYPLHCVLHPLRIICHTLFANFGRQRRLRFPSPHELFDGRVSSQRLAPPPPNFLRTSGPMNTSVA